MKDLHFNARVIQVIETDLLLAGTGENADPYRRVRQYYSLDGELLAEVDPYELRDAEISGEK